MILCLIFGNFFFVSSHNRHSFTTLNTLPFKITHDFCRFRWSVLSLTLCVHCPKSSLFYKMLVHIGSSQVNFIASNKFRCASNSNKNKTSIWPQNKLRGRNLNWWCKLDRLSPQKQVPNLVYTCFRFISPALFVLSHLFTKRRIVEPPGPINQNSMESWNTPKQKSANLWSRGH